MPGSIRLSPLIFNSATSSAALNRVCDDPTTLITLKSDIPTTCCFPSSSHRHHLHSSGRGHHPVASTTTTTIHTPVSRFTKFRVSAAASGGDGAGAASSDTKYEEYEVELEKPIGLKFYKGRDGGVYIDAIAPGGSADKTKQFTPGDRVIATSAVFGTEMWPAAAYGQTMYTIRQRIGTLVMKMERRFGEREDAAVPRDLVAAERNAGYIGEAVREIQVKNYLRKMELKKQREEDLEEGLKLYKAGQYKEALDKFDSVLGAKPEYNEEAVANYNVACCYSKLNEVEAGLSALEAALEAGFEDYKTVRTDPDLANIRNSPKFKPMIDRFDEPFINENALNALKNVFGIFGKK